MAIHLCGWAEDIDLGGTAQGLTALADAIVFTDGDNMRIPELDKLILAAVGLPSDTALEPEARIEAPSQQRYVPVHLGSVNGGADADVEPSSPHRVQDFRDSPIQFTRSENATVVVNADSTAAAFSWVLVWMGTGIDPIPSGRRMTIRYTGATTLTARAWSNVPITLQQNLPTGRYAITGLLPLSASCIAGRVVFRGGSPGSWRPGALGTDDLDNLPSEIFRHGGLGSYGEFESDSLPSIEYLADLADTAEEGLIDLVQVREGR